MALGREGIVDVEREAQLSGAIHTKGVAILRGYLALNDAYGRLKLLLEALAEPARADGSRVVHERLTHRDVSNRLGCSREMVSRLMKDLERGGYLHSDGGQLVLTRALPARW